MNRMTAAGAAAAALTAFLFFLYRLRGIRKRTGARITAGEFVNAVGFSLLPGLAFWKAFEPYILSYTGKEVPAPLPLLPWVTAEGRFYPSRIETAALVIAFTAIVLWLVFRKEDLPGNGDLLLSVICVWAAIRSVTESFRQDPLAGIGPVSLFVCLSIAAGLLCLAIWTARRGRKTKNAGLTILDWLAVIACGAVMILQDAGVLPLGSGIADLAARCGCAVLSMVLILITGKDSRT